MKSRILKIHERKKINYLRETNNRVVRRTCDFTKTEMGLTANVLNALGLGFRTVVSGQKRGFLNSNELRNYLGNYGFSSDTRAGYVYYGTGALFQIRLSRRLAYYNNITLSSRRKRGCGCTGVYGYFECSVHKKKRRKKREIYTQFMFE